MGFEAFRFRERFKGFFGILFVPYKFVPYKKEGKVPERL